MNGASRSTGWPLMVLMASTTKSTMKTACAAMIATLTLAIVVMPTTLSTVTSTMATKANTPIGTDGNCALR